ncbi:MAG: hypothetical protein OXE44_00785 [Nitrospinae bacterium]|nr:hypothetical protein [Nitrospinota bacterium]
MRKPKPPASTFLTHLLGQGLADERYEVRRYRSSGGGELKPLPAGESAGRISRTAFREAVACFFLRPPLSPAGTGRISPSIVERKRSTAYRSSARPRLRRWVRKVLAGGLGFRIS